MPFLGPTFNLTTNEFYPAVDGVVLDADAWNAVAEDLANGLTAVVTRDGAGSMSGALNMGTHKITNLAAAESSSDAVRYDQVTPVDPTLIAWGNLAFDATNNMGYSTGVDTFALLATTAAGRAFLSYVDPNADKIVYWKDADGTVASVSLGTGLTFSSGSLAVSANLQIYSGITPSANVQSFLGAADYAAMRTQLSLGALATVTPGTGVATALAVNVGSAGAIVVNGGALGTPSSGTLSSCTGLPVSTGISGFGTNVATALAIAIGSAGAVVTSNSTDTLSNKTLSSPTLSGTVTGGVVFTGSNSLGAGRTHVIGNSELYAFSVQYGTGTGYIYFGATNSASPDGVFSNNAGSSILTLKNDRSVAFSGDATVAGALQARVAISSETSGTLTSASANKQLQLTGGITMPNSVFTAGDMQVIDPGTSSRTITRGSGIAMYVNGTDSASATIPANQVCGAVWRSASVCVLTGPVS